MTSYIKKLPEVFQTSVESKFFNATVDQVFSKKDSDQLFGYIGRRIPGQYDPVNDFYLPEPSKDRTWWQLEATAFARNADSTKSNIFFYDDLLNRINYYGGNTLNQDRLFESEYYSWAPPIDFDMFINYQNYYWVDSGLPTISVTGLTDAEITAIIGQPSYTITNPAATPLGLVFTTGLKVQFENSIQYPTTLTVENMGGCAGIRLLEPTLSYNSSPTYEYLPWSGDIQLANGRVIRNSAWDTATWDVQVTPGVGDYITIERGSADNNAWSRSNSWYHIDAINYSCEIAGVAFPSTATRALRPIIQFCADLVLFKSGTQFKSNISYGFREDVSGQPLLLSSYQGQSRNYIDTALNIQLQNNQLSVFMEDPSNNQSILSVNIDLITDIVTFIPVGTQVVDGDIVFAISDAPYNGASRGQTWYYNINEWAASENEKVATNQAPLFQLYDHNKIPLNDTVTYPQSTFAGSKIFSYKINTIVGAPIDPVLKFPIAYNSLGQATDIIFQNNLITDRYVYGLSGSPISGYYYYTLTDSQIYYNNWNLYIPGICTDEDLPAPSKQRVIDKFVVGYGTQYQFKLSVMPYNYPSSPDIIVSVDGNEVNAASLTNINGYVIEVINNSVYVDLQNYLTALFSTAQTVPPVVEINTYTRGILDPAEPGYFEMPQQLEANPLQEEVGTISASNLIQQFSSIIRNQIGFVGTSFGGSNNYRDSGKNRSVGLFILQNTAPVLKSMLVSSSNDLDFITSERFSQDEYTKFKNKFLGAAKQLIDQEFNPVQYHNNAIVVSAWVDAIVKTVNISKEFSSAFAYSYMIANGTPYQTETQTVPVDGTVTLANYIDLSDQRNALYVYDTTLNEKLLMIGIDYEIVSTNLVIEIRFYGHVGESMYIALYKNPLPAYIPSTPTKIGAYSAYIPRMELDMSYTVPAWVIVGHDGSKTMAYGDYRDNLLLELETRIYNLLQYKFRNDYVLPLRIEHIKSGYYRQTRYSRAEYLNITESYLNKWSAKNRANYRVNDWAAASADLPINSPELWKLYNYTAAVTSMGAPIDLPGNWKGIFQYYYDTIFPDTRPWEMLGLTSMPVWWVTQYGLNWGSTNTALWSDLEAGIIRQGPSAIFNPVTLLPMPQQMWARPGLSAIIPVDALGQIIPVPVLFNVAMSGNPYEPFDGYDDPWVYGDGAPVEQAWMSTSGYAFSVQEFLYLMKPGPFGELLFDTVGTTLSPGKLNPVDPLSPIIANGAQYVQTDKWMRPKNVDQYVHAEIVDGTVQIKYGYQRWISDRILFLGKDVATTFGQKIRTLDVNLANKLAGFTNKDTTTTYIESASTTGTSSLLIPTNNFGVMLHKGQPIKTYVYSGVIIRALADGTFVVYGYDLQNSAFTVLDRSTAQAVDITIGGTPAEFKVYTLGDTYYAGDIVRYNGIYYQSIGTVVAAKFSSTNWQKLKTLPTIGGVSVSYYPISEVTYTTVPYGTALASPQAVFDLLIGWGAYLETQGWEFTDVSTETNQVSDWLYSAKQFLFWLNTNWSPDASIQLSPAANKVVLTVQRGYPDDVEVISNGVYSIMDKYGVAMPPNSTSTDRSGMSITVSPVNLSVGGIYFLQVHASETEHIIIFDNSTSFSDVIYDPLLRARQGRLRFNGFRSNGWYGKKEAPGYLIIDNQLVPNYDTIVNDMRYYYDPNVTIDNPSIESLGRHLIGYESKSYLDNLQLANDVQYLFYKGAIRQKGSIQALDKLFRSGKILDSNVVEVYEEWALKLADFGNTVEQVSTEFKLKPEQNSGEVIVACLNFVPSPVGFVREINILNAENRYTTVPRIQIGAPDADINDLPAGAVLRQARAYAVLNSSGIISRIDITDRGYGYMTAPDITIYAGTELNNLDKLYSVWQGEIINDIILDNIVNIDIDNTDVWIVRPPNPSYSLVFPTTDNIHYSTPNAGYVNFNDVSWASFDVTQTYATWGTSALNPVENDTVWVAKTFTEDWDVYKMVNIAFNSYNANPWRVINDTAGNLLLLTDLTVLITPEFSVSTEHRTDFGNTICLQQSGVTNRIFQINPSIGSSVTDPWNFPVKYTDPDTLIEYYSYDLLDLSGAPVTSNDVGNYELFTDLLLFKTMRWESIPIGITPPEYVSVNDKIWVDNVNSKWTVFNVISLGHWDISNWDSALGGLWGIPGTSNPGWDPTGITAYRMQEPLINSSLFENAQVFQSKTQDELVLLPVYDAFKNILPAAAKQNITYMLLQDPAKYNVTGDVRLFSETTTFGNAQVGKIWWDLSTVRYVYCEQPMALDGSESVISNLEYRRNQWSQPFPGSTFNMYEWTRSPVPPSQYTGSGRPRSTTDYVQLSTSNKFTNIIETNYYFWVLNPTSKPNIENRTLAALEVAQLMATPKSQGFTFFCPIQQTPTNNSYMFYNVQEILAYKGDNIQIQYRVAERNDRTHTQWQFFREGDASSLVTGQYWDKMVDSLCGYTKMLPVTNEWSTGIIIANELPWDIHGYDISPFDNATSATWANINQSTYGEILPVPDPALTNSEKYGINYRPRQGMFVNLAAARKVFVQSCNNLLKHIPIRDNNASWDADVQSSTYWEYTTWYKVGYEDATPLLVFETLADAHVALTLGNIPTGTIIEIINGTADGRFMLYTAEQVDAVVPTQSLEPVAIEKSAIKLLDTIYTVHNIYGLSVELRQLLGAFRTKVFIDQYIVNQNELYFSLLNYVYSEQKNPDWTFKSSYIYIKENNIPLTQTTLYMPNQIDNIINYIVDAKPYHTHVRDYTAVHSASDIAIGTSSDSMLSKTVMQFGPEFGGLYEYSRWDSGCSDNLLAWDSQAWDVCPLNYSVIVDAAERGTMWDLAAWMLQAWDVESLTEQFISNENLYRVSLVTEDTAKIGYSQLVPYTFSISSITENDPQTFITPANVVNITIDNVVLTYGKDYYVEYNSTTTDYTAYFYKDPGALTVKTAYILWDGGALIRFGYSSNRTEIAYGIPTDDFVINVDTQLPVNIVSNIPYPIAPWGTTASGVDPLVASHIVAAGGVAVLNPIIGTQGVLPVTISFKQNLGITHNLLLRNAGSLSGVLLNNIDVPGWLPPATPYVIDVSATSDIFPSPTSHAPGIVWINGERIEYRNKELIGINTWQLSSLRRGSQSTTLVSHSASSTVWIEINNNIPDATGGLIGANSDVWNATNPAPDPGSSVPGGYTSILGASAGGLWYADTSESQFLKERTGSAVS